MAGYQAYKAFLEKQKQNKKGTTQMNCNENGCSMTPALTAADFAVGDKVFHPKHGNGIVKAVKLNSYAGDLIDAQYESGEIFTHRSSIPTMTKEWAKADPMSVKFGEKDVENLGSFTLDSVEIGALVYSPREHRIGTVLDKVAMDEPDDYEDPVIDSILVGYKLPNGTVSEIKHRSHMKAMWLTRLPVAE